MDLFDENGNVLSYEDFMFTYNFPIPFKEFQQVMKAIPNGLKHLMKSHLTFGGNERKFPDLIVDGIKIFSHSCNNKHIRSIFQSNHKITPRGKFFWNAQITGINWKEAWLNPYKFCMLNKVKEVHFKIKSTHVKPHYQNPWTSTTNALFVLYTRKTWPICFTTVIYLKNFGLMIFLPQ